MIGEPIITGSNRKHFSLSFWVIQQLSDGASLFASLPPILGIVDVRMGHHNHAKWPAAQEWRELILRDTTPSNREGLHMAKRSRRSAKKTAKRRTLQRWTKQHIKELRAHSRARTSVAVISKQTKRTAHALRMKASQLGLPLGHHRWFFRLRAPLSARSVLHEGLNQSSPFFFGLARLVLHRTMRCFLF